MKKVITSMALAVLCIGASAQTTTTTTTVGSDQNCMAMADEQTWSTLGLNPDQVRRVKEIQTRFKGAEHMDRGTENTMRGTSDDRATPTGTTGTGTAVTDHRPTGTTGTTGTDHAGSTGTTGTDRAGTTGTDRAGTTATPGTDRAGTTTGKEHAGTMGKSSDQLGYDDSNKEAMERELRTVLTTQQFNSYQEWCQGKDATRGGRDDMDR